ncbi:MAG: FxSxx-COOH system tetratricopeptide repeat protein, partial [Actinocrinis sp.]
HTLITSRNTAWTTSAAPLEIDVFARGESMELLTRRVPGLGREDADLVADELGDLPLAVEVAAAWLAQTGVPVAEYLGRLRDESSRILSLNKPTGYPHTVEATWNVSLQRLSERSPAAVRMLQLCAFFAPEISLNLIYSDEMVEALVGIDDSLREKLVLGRVIQEIGRLALARVDLPGNSIQIHRLVQAVIRNQIPDDEQREDTYHRVHRILAAARPRQGDTDDPANWPRYDIIWPHLEPSDAIQCVEEPVRQLLIDRVRYLWKSGNLDAALATARQLEVAWQYALDTGGEPASDAPRRNTLTRQLLNLRFQIGNVLRSQGNYAEARSLDEAVLADQRELLPAEHPHTLMTAGGLAADLRGLSQFQSALDLDRTTFASLKDVFGEEHPRTLVSANNLAISYRLVGDCYTAREIDQDTLEKRRAVIGPKHPYTLTSAEHLARDLREIGEYQQSVTLLRATYETFQEVLGADFTETLRTAKSLAVSLRRAGELAAARLLTEDTLKRYENAFQAGTPDALACQLNYAADLSVQNEKRRAADMTREVLAAYERRLEPNHPYTLMCLTNLSMYQRDLDEGLNDSARLARRAHDGFVDSVGENHPYSLCAALNLANVLAARGELDEAERLERFALAGLIQRFGPMHPDGVIARSNLSITLAAAGREEEARLEREQAVTAIRERLGAEHPNSVAVRGGLRVNRDLEPQPI